MKESLSDGVEILGHCKNLEGLSLNKSLSLLRCGHDCLSLELDLFLLLVFITQVIEDQKTGV